MTDTTAQVAQRFIAAFQRKDAAAIPELVAPDCIMEAMQPAPNGQRVEGYEANVAFWQALASDPSGTFEVEDLLIHGDRATNRWRYRFGSSEAETVRGVTLLTVRLGKIVEALAYAKTSPITDLGQSAATTRSTSEVIQRYNDAFQSHDPSLLVDLIAPDCIIENTNPAPHGSRHVGHAACLALWSRIAGSPTLRFDLEDVSIVENRATIRWHLHWGSTPEESVRGVNLMRVEAGLIVEALGYVKGV